MDKKRGSRKRRGSRSSRSNPDSRKNREQLASIINKRADKPEVPKNLMLYHTDGYHLPLSDEDFSTFPFHPDIEELLETRSNKIVVCRCIRPSPVIRDAFTYVDEKPGTAEVKEIISDLRVPDHDLLKRHLQGWS